MPNMVEPLFIEGSYYYPEINFNASIGLLKIDGMSVDANESGFYKPVFEWLQEYQNYPHNETILKYKVRLL